MILASLPPQDILTNNSEDMLSVYCITVTGSDDEINGEGTISLLKNYAMTSPKTALKNRISELDNLSDNWDGYDAIAPFKDVVKNSFKFIDCILDEGYLLNEDDITPTPYGSIVLDFKTEAGIVSVEIGKSQIGFFTEFTNHIDYSSDGIETNFKQIPDALKSALELLYKRQERIGA